MFSILGKRTALKIHLRFQRNCIARDGVNAVTHELLQDVLAIEATNPAMCETLSDDDKNIIAARTQDAGTDAAGTSEAGDTSPPVVEAAPSRQTGRRHADTDTAAGHASTPLVDHRPAHRQAGRRHADTDAEAGDDSSAARFEVAPAHRQALGC